MIQSSTGRGGQDLLVVSVALSQIKRKQCWMRNGDLWVLTWKTALIPQLEYMLVGYNRQTCLATQTAYV